MARRSLKYLLNRYTLSFRNRIVVIAVGMVICLLSLVYTNRMAHDLREKEQHDVEVHDRFRDLGVHVFNGLADALAFITSLVSVAQFQRFAGPRGSPGRDGGTAYMTGIKGNFYLYRRIAARIKNFAGPN